MLAMLALPAEPQRMADAETPVYVSGSGSKEKLLSVEFVRKYIMLAKLRW